MRWLRSPENPEQHETNRLSVTPWRSIRHGSFERRRNSARREQVAADGAVAAGHWRRPWEANLPEGGKALAGRGNFYPPTVLTRIPKDSPAYSEEFFGPVASVFRVESIDEAIAIANDSRFGLGASAWTNDPRERERFISDLESGMVFINQMVASDPRVPFGGVKASGHGRELGPYGIREFTNTKTIWIRDLAK